MTAAHGMASRRALRLGRAPAHWHPCSLRRPRHRAARSPPRAGCAQPWPV